MSNLTLEQITNAVEVVEQAKALAYKFAKEHYFPRYYEKQPHFGVYDVDIDVEELFADVTIEIQRCGCCYDPEYVSFPLNYIFDDCWCVREDTRREEERRRNEERKKQLRAENEQKLKQRRREQYERLKKEFENE